jgi:hypothetical protein
MTVPPATTTPHSGWSHLTVAVPVLFVDEQMPHLRDTALRVVLAVLRQTQVTGFEKRSAWLTHAELCRRTGRAGEAVSAAIEQLVKLGLLEVQDEAGKPLLSPRERQQAQGRRFYRVRNVGDLDNQRRCQDTAKAKTIEDIENTYGLRKTDPSLPRAKATTSSPEEQKHIEEEKGRIRERLRSLARQR